MKLFLYFWIGNFAGFGPNLLGETGVIGWLCEAYHIGETEPEIQKVNNFNIYAGIDPKTAK